MEKATASPALFRDKFHTSARTTFWADVGNRAHGLGSEEAGKARPVMKKSVAGYQRFKDEEIGEGKEIEDDDKEIEEIEEEIEREEDGEKDFKELRMEARWMA